MNFIFISFVSFDIVCESELSVPGNDSTRIEGHITNTIKGNANTIKHAESEKHVLSVLFYYSNLF